MFKAIGFDMDGTLIDSDIDYARLGMVEHDVLTSLGVPSRVFAHIMSEKDMLVAGIDYLHSIGKDISSDELERMVNEESTRIETLNISSSKPFPMVRELLDEISSKGYKIGLLSRGHRGYVLKTMDRFDLTGYFDAIEAYDDHPVGEQKPNPVAMEYLAKGLGVRTDEMIYVGDAVTDYLCARDSGAAFIGLAQNEHSRTMWKSYNHRPEILNNISELIGRF